MITSKMILHPEDSKALQVLKSIPFVDTICRKMLKWSYEGMCKGDNMSSYILITKENMPKVYNLFKDVVNKVGIDEPELYVYNDPFMNAYTYGEVKPFVAVSSSCIEKMEDDELQAIMAHECGHILCKHVLYNSVANLLWVLGDKIGNFGMKLNGPIYMALHYWSRKSELSADRCAAAVVGEDAFQRTMMKLSCGLTHLPVNTKQLVQQGKEYNRMLEDSLLNKIRFNSDVSWHSHPRLCLRALEIDRWKNSFAYRTLTSNLYEKEIS